MQAGRTAVFASLAWGIVLAATGGAGAAEVTSQLLASFEPGEGKGVSADGKAVKEHATHGAHALRMEHPGKGYTSINIEDRALRFDIVAVIAGENGPEARHYENAFTP